MTIDVYDNNCPAAIDAADIDSDCITDLEDFVEMAEDWLVDYTLTEAAEKP
jgi:hypothetical protein